jgi:hypothetical protein
MKATYYLYKSATIAKVIKRPHLLFIGADGSKTFGITVESVHAPNPAYLQKWTVNDFTWKRSIDSDDGDYLQIALGLTAEQIDEITKEFKDLHNEE